MFSECIATMAQLPVLVVAEQLQQQYLEVPGRREVRKIEKA